uniref:Large ribosomal subunit protein uL22c n=1 Tax=Periphykon beckeri TaxID=2006982 RepID=A0A1Z1M347_9FLOR|nr:ribosomal protein L22 [Periphykon beckeri]ARW60446.1 ribosomal protein L22 [Periphykon beckeri]
MKSKKIQSQATTKYIRTSQYKSSRVLKQIQGKNYNEAKLMLEFMPYRSCKIILKTLDSAFHNIKQLNNINTKQIKIIKAYANKGPILKRFQPRAQGRAFPIRKPTCHIIIKLELQ